MNTKTLLAVAAGFSVVAAAGAQPIDLTVDPAQSLIDVEIELVTPVGTRIDSDSDPIVGSITIELDDTAAPTQLTLTAFDFTNETGLSFVFDYGVLGSVNASGTGLGLRKPVGSADAVGPVAQPSGDFTLSSVEAEAQGIISITSSGLIGATVGNQTTDLNGSAAGPVELSGTVAVSGSTVTVTAVVPITVSDQSTPGVTANLSGTATIVATGTVPDDPCVADANADGLLSPADFNAWILAFNTQAPACDQNGDGLCTPADFNAWIINFNAGC